MKPFTVIGMHSETGRVFGVRVEARDCWSAFAKASRAVKKGVEDIVKPDMFGLGVVELPSDASLIACVPGHVEIAAPCGDSGSTCTVLDYLGES